MATTDNLDLPYIAAAQAQKHVPHNEALRALDALVQLSVSDRDLTSPPASPTAGERYIVPPGGVNDWAGHDRKIAAWQDGAWAFFAAQAGWLAWVADENQAVVYNGTDWQPLASGGGSGSVNPTGLVGVNATADTTNRLSVKAPAILLDAEADSHRLKVNKAAAADTASIIFQTGYQGRAEFGLTGDDDFHLKVSPDGANWADAMVVDNATGAVSFPNSSLGGGGGFTPFSQRVFVRQTTTVTAANGSFTVVPWDTETYDIGGFWQSGAPDRLSMPQAGTVLLWGYIAYTATVGTVNFIQVQHKDTAGTTIGNFAWDMSSNGYASLASGPISTAAGDYFELRVYQNAGAARALHTDGRNYFSCARIA